MKRDPRAGKLADMEATARGLGSILGGAIEAKHGKGEVGFCLMLFSFGEGGWSTYVSNAQRPDMVNALREFIRKLEAR